MAKYEVAYDPDTRVALIQEEGASAPQGHTNIGTVEHPDPIYPGSVVLYHGVRDLLYKVSHEDPSEAAMFPNNVTDMQNISIELDSEIVPEDPEDPEDP